jgi:spore germination protein
MDIHVVQQGETIYSIAERYGVSVSRLALENEINITDNLVQGQTIVITYPESVYTVKEGDTLESIAQSNNITVMQLVRNNPFLAERDFIIQGETLVISYSQRGRLTTTGYALPFINRTILRKTLPYLTYLFVYNYRLMANGEVETFYDDNYIIETSIAYGTLPIMLVTTLSAQGSENVLSAYEILLNEEIQDRLINNILLILRTKGYYGINMTFLYMTETNEKLYNNFTTKISRRIMNEGYLVFATINPETKEMNAEVNINKVDYTEIGSVVRGISFISYVFGTNISPPSPVSSIANLSAFLDYVSTMVPVEKITAGIQMIAYDWEIPYVAGFSKANSLTVVGAVHLARDVSAVIKFDELSQTPYFEYTQENNRHIVWFVDARTVNSLLNLISEKGYKGPGVWNTMNYYPQLWLVINSQYDVEKLI